jgi:hypothetical protein
VESLSAGFIMPAQELTAGRIGASSGYEQSVKAIFKGGCKNEYENKHAYFFQ